MPWTSAHIKWLIDAGQRLKTADGKDDDVWEFRHEAGRSVRNAEVVSSILIASTKDNRALRQKALDPELWEHVAERITSKHCPVILLWIHGQGFSPLR